MLRLKYGLFVAGSAFCFSLLACHSYRVDGGVPQTSLGSEPTNVRLALDDGTSIEVRSAVARDSIVVGLDPSSGKPITVSAKKIRKVETSHFDVDSTLLAVGGVVIALVGLFLLIATHFSQSYESF